MNSITRILLTLCLMAAFLSETVADTLTVRSLFTEMPDSVIPYLTRTNRLDFLDFMDSNMKAEVTNELAGKSVMTALADDSLTIRLNEACTVRMLLLPTLEPVDSSRHVIVLVRSYRLADKATESDVSCYSLRWRQLDTLPAMRDDDRKRLSDAVKASNILKYYIEFLNKD